jgi:transposase InsO family protein
MAYAGPPEAKSGIGRYFAYFNEQRSHQALGNQTPMEVYLASAAARRKLAA